MGYKPDNERDYGSESIEILLQVMENQREDLVIILAGYKKAMDKFYESNPGLSSRIANHIVFPDYIAKRREKPLFANARSVKNALDRARMRQANRIFNSNNEVLTKKQLTDIEADDILQSTVFD